MRSFFLVCFFATISKDFLAQNLKAQLNQCAVDCQLEHNYDKAIAFFTDVILLYPNDSIAYMDRGIAREEQKDLKGAIADFTLQIEVDSMSADSYFLRAILKEKMGNDTGAIADYEHVSYWDDGNADAHYFRGLLRVKAEDYESAQNDMQLALIANPEHAGAYAYRGWLKILQKDLKAGLSDIDSALFFEPQFSRAHLLKGSVLAEMGYYDQAFTSYCKAFELDPYLRIDYLRLPGMKQRLKKYKKIQLVKVPQMKKNDNDTLSSLIYARALLYVQLNSRAKKQLDLMASGMENQSEWYYFNGYYFAQEKKLKQAFPFYEKVSQLEPSNQLFLLVLAELSMKLKKPQQACNYFSRYNAISPLVDYSILWNSCQ